MLTQKVATKTIIDFQKTIQFAFEKDMPWAIWQLPQQTTQHFIIDWKKETPFLNQEIENVQAGFVVSPFINPNLKKTYFIAADLHFTYQTHLSNFQLEYKEKQGFQNIDFQQFIHQMNEFEPQKNLQNKLKNNQTIKNHSKNFHIQLVEKGIQAIQHKKFQKVVLSKQKYVPYTFESLDFIEKVFKNYQNLCKNYPNAFCYLFFLPQEKTMWLGASPEILISINKNHIFKTVALAGTQKYNPDIPLNQMTWGQKEIEEQAMVSRYIINCFKKIRLREFEEEGPKTVVAGNLIHLKTFFEVDMKSSNFMQLGSVMMQLLHPTSAVCGMPKEESQAFILENEKYDREFYSGFLGAINIEDETHIYVNLRCLQFLKEGFCLYAGGGVTEDSVPEKEWEETEWKCQTLLNVLDL